MKAGIALGSNVGDRLANLKAAREHISKLSDIGPPVRASAVYETEPVGCEANAGKFLNAVIEIGYSGTATELLRELRRIETALGRPASHAKNTSRTLDLDLLFFGDERPASAELELPHPRMHERRFVLQPLADICPALVLQGQNEDVATLLERLPDAAPLVRFAAEW